MVTDLKRKDVSFFVIAQLPSDLPEDERAKHASKNAGLFACLVVTQGQLIAMRDSVLDKNKLGAFEQDEKKKVCLSFLEDEQNSLTDIKFIKDRSYKFLEGKESLDFLKFFRNESRAFFTEKGSCLDVTGGR